MKIASNISSFLKNLPLKTMRGEDVFVAIASFLSGGSCDTEIETKAVKNNWQKSVTGKKYHPVFASRARGRIHPTRTGHFLLTKEGASYAEELTGGIPAFATSLLVFKEGSTHSFDKFLRGIFRTATTAIDIADTYVSGKLFDTLLDEIPNTLPVRFIYGNDTGGFVLRAERFAREYNFNSKESKKFHDRFLIVDGKGYIIGPSLKDAADKKPATVVVLNVDDSKKLIDLFATTWKTTK